MSSPRWNLVSRCSSSSPFIVDSNSSFPTCAQSCAASCFPIRRFQTETTTLTRDQVRVPSANSSGRPRPAPSPGPRVNLTLNPSNDPPPSYPTPCRIRDPVHVPCPSRLPKMHPQGVPIVPLGRHHPSNGLSVAKSACRVDSNLEHSNHKRVNPTPQVRKYQPSQCGKTRRKTSARKV